MAFVAEDGIAHIVVVRYLYAVKQNDVFQLGGIAHHGPCAHQSAAADKGTVANFGILADDTRAGDMGSGVDRCGFGDPNIGSRMIVLCRGKSRAQFLDEIGDSAQCFPGVGILLQERSSKGVVQVIEVMNGIHYINSNIALGFFTILYTNILCFAIVKSAG